MVKTIICACVVLLFCGTFCSTFALSLEERYERITAISAEYGAGGHLVLKTAYDALSKGNYSLVGIEDLWAVALKEGKKLFDSEHLWSATGPLQTGDMLGQTTIGPWQITIQTARQLGIYYGISKGWDDAQLILFLETKPELQADLAADLIEASYQKYGRRTPYAIQSYFWLEGFLQKKIGQGRWYDSVLAKNRTTMRNTGFYAKQLLLGSRFNPKGLLYWLYVTGDEAAIREVLRSWSAHGYPIHKEDLSHCACNADFQHYLRAML